MTTALYHHRQTAFSAFTPSITGDIMMLQLPEALRKNILRFLPVHSSDHLSLAFTCRQLLQDVKAFSKNELDRITREHDVNDDWIYRDGMQAVVAGQHVARWLIPPSVSQRRMLWSAYRTHIYSLGTDPSQEWTGVLDLAMHPNGERLPSGGHGHEFGSTSVRLWDVRAKRCIRSFVGHRGSVNNVYFCAGNAATDSWEGEDDFRFWDLDNGTCQHSFEMKLGPGTLAAYNEEVFAPYPGEENGAIIAIGIDGEDFRSNLCRRSWCTDNMAGVHLYLCGDFLLAAVPCGDYDDEGVRELAGIYLLDRSSLEEMKHVPGVYGCINSATNGDVVAEKADGSFDVFQLDADHIVKHHSFQRHPSSEPSNFRLKSILLVHNSRAYVQSNRDGPECCIEVYNIFSGGLERTLLYPLRSLDGAYIPECLVASETELFCGFNMGDSSISNAFSAIKVYLLD
jgi:WD40 repeat protein